MSESCNSPHLRASLTVQAQRRRQRRSPRARASFPAPSDRSVGSSPRTSCVRYTAPSSAEERTSNVSLTRKALTVAYTYRPSPIQYFFHLAHPPLPSPFFLLLRPALALGPAEHEIEDLPRIIPPHGPDGSKEIIIPRVFSLTHPPGVRMGCQQRLRDDEIELVRRTGGETPEELVHDDLPRALRRGDDEILRGGPVCLSTIVMVVMMMMLL